MLLLIKSIILEDTETEREREGEREREREYMLEKPVLKNVSNIFCMAYYLVQFRHVLFVCLCVCLCLKTVLFLCFYGYFGKS